MIPIRRLSVLTLFSLAAPLPALSGQAVVPSGGGFELVAEIGSDLGAPEYVFGDVRDLAVGPQGQIAVLDAMAGEIRVFDQAGRFQRSMGRQGGGPGEFSYPLALFADPTRIVVVDPQSARNTVFSWTGELLASNVLPAPGGRPLATQLLLAHDYRVGVTMGGFSSRDFDTPRPESVVLVDPSTEKLDTIIRYHQGGIRWRSERGTGGLPGFHEPGGAWAVLNDSSLLTVDGSTGELVVWSITESGAVRQRTVSTDLRPPVLTADEISEAVTKARADLRRDHPDRPDYITRSPEAAGPTHWAGIRSIVVERQDRVWLEFGAGPEGYFDGRPSRWFVLDLDSENLRELEVPSDLDVRRVRSGRIYGIARTEYESQIVRVYRISAAIRDSF